MPDSFDNNSKFDNTNKVHFRKIKDFEKDIGIFIEKVNLITDSKNHQFSLSLKNKYDSNQITRQMLLD